jgi:hypothetical protein
MSATDQGFNFRGTVDPLGGGTDGSDETYVLGDQYPTTRAGWTFGWSEPINAADRNYSYERRLLGINWDGSTATNEFRVDLPSAGDWDVYGAFGDAENGGVSEWFLLDNGTLFQTITPQAFTASPNATFKDATDTNYTAANWPANNAAVTRTFGSTIFQCRVGSTTIVVLAHLRLVQAGGGGQTADVPVGLIEFLGVAPSTAKSAAVPIGLAEVQALAATSKKSLSVGIGLVRVGAGPVTSKKSASVQVGLVEVSAIAPLTSGDSDVQIGLVEVLALTPTTKKTVTTQIGLVEVRGLSPESAQEVSVQIGLIEVTAIALASSKSAAIPVGLIEVIGLEPLAETSEFYTITLVLATNDDDAEASQSAPEAIRTNRATTSKEAAFRFVNASALAGMQIESAVLRLTALGEFVSDIHNKVMLEAADAAAQFTTVASYAPFAARPTTTAQVDWDPPDELFPADHEFDSPDIAFPVQEVIDREGYGGVLHVLLKFDDGWLATIGHFHRDGSVAKSAKLIVTYSIPEEFHDISGEAVIGRSFIATPSIGRSFSSRVSFGA